MKAIFLRLLPWLIGTAAVILIILAPTVLPAIVSRVKYHGDIRESLANDLLPTAQFVRSFHERHGRLPDDAEFELYKRDLKDNHALPWLEVTLYRQPLSGTNEWGTPGRDFMLTSSVPEWNLYYQSWNGKVLEAWTD